MFTSRRVTRTLALAGAAAAIAATSAAAAPTQEPAQMPVAAVQTDMPSYGLGADVSRSAAAFYGRPVPTDDIGKSPAPRQELPYRSYGPTRPSARPDIEPGGDIEWPIVGLIGVGGLLIAAGVGTAIHKARVRRTPTRVTA